MSVHDLSTIEPSSTELATGADSLLALALNKGVPVETIERLVALVERAEARRSEKSYFAALAKFQSECPLIPRSTEKTIALRQGAGFTIRYAEADQILTTIRPYLQANGLSFTWDEHISDDGARLSESCIIRHVDGYAAPPVTVSIPTATVSPMTEQHRYTAARTTAQRLSLSSALGLVTTDDAPDAPHGLERITPEQSATLAALLDEVKPDVAKFMAYAGVATVEEIPANRYAELVALLEKRRKAGA